MPSAEYYPSGPNDDPLKFSFGQSDFDMYQSRMLNKFSLELFIPDSVPHFVLEDLTKFGAAIQPIPGGSHISWCDKPKAVAEIRSLKIIG